LARCEREEIMRPSRKITPEEDNARLVPIGNTGFESIKRDFVEPEPVGTIILMAFRITGYGKDCDGSAMICAEHIDKDGDASGWDIDSIGMNPDGTLVVLPEELKSLF
jgi:hypothetical protein